MKGIVVAFLVSRTVFRADWLKIGKKLECDATQSDDMQFGSKLQCPPENICRTDSE